MGAVALLRTPILACMVNRGYIDIAQVLMSKVLEGTKVVFYLMMYSTHFIYGYVASDI